MVTPLRDPASVESLIDAGDFEGARKAMAEIGDRDERFTVVRIKLGLLDGSLEPGVAMQQLIQLMRKDENFPGAKALYQEASRLAYQSRQSSIAHSHPPPPTKRS